MYACKLFFNGSYRKVLIDDFVPVRKDGRILCAHTKTRREMWVTLLEKAFIKLMGGSYFVQGSNPGADLFHLTGWIPETIPFRKELNTKSPDLFKPVVTGGIESAKLARDPQWDTVWRKLHDGFRQGTLIACLGTSEIVDAAPTGLDFPEGVSISSGIVAKHAYSILDIKEVDGRIRLLYVRNPWAIIRWKGPFCPGDHANWTPALEQVCNYDSKLAASSADDGSFWIQWHDVITWFSHLYLCWNPRKQFKYEHGLHSRWGMSPYLHSSTLLDDAHLVFYNPQFKLEVEPLVVQRASEEEIKLKNGKLSEICAVWILLSRHIRDRKKDVYQKYVACHLYEDTEGARLVCPSHPAHQGVYSNGECTLLKINVRRPVIYTLNRTADSSSLSGGEIVNPSTTLIPVKNVLSGPTLLLVVSQYSQKATFNFSVTAFSKVRVQLSEIPQTVDEYNWTTLTARSHWTNDNCGGSPNEFFKYLRNPHFRLVIPENCLTHILLESAMELSVNLRLFEGPSPSARAVRLKTASLTSGSYRAGCCHISADLAAGVYTIIPSTFKQGEKGPFQIVVHLGLTRHYKTLKAHIAYNTMFPLKDAPSGTLDLLQIPSAFNPMSGLHSLSLRQPNPNEFYALFTLKPHDPVTYISICLRILQRPLPKEVMPTLTAFYCMKPQSSSRYHGASTKEISNKSRRRALMDAGLMIPARRRFRKPSFLTEAWKDYDPTAHIVAGVLRYSDVEGGLSESGTRISTAALQYYQQMVSMIRNTSYSSLIVTAEHIDDELAVFISA